MGDKFPHIVECYDLAVLSSASPVAKIDPLERIVVRDEAESQKADHDLALAHPNCYIVHVPFD